MGDEVVVRRAVAGDIAGFYALVRDKAGARLDHLWVLPEMVGAGLGRRLFEHARHRAGALGAEALRIEADPNAAAFYSKMGARRVGERIDEIEGHKRALPILTAATTRPFPG